MKLFQIFVPVELFILFFGLCSSPEKEDKVLQHIEAMKLNGTLTNVVNALVSSGEFCTIRGHCWKVGCGMIGCGTIHYDRMRHCVLCGRVQSQTVSEWK